MNNIILANLEENIIRNNMKKALKISITNGLSVMGILLLMGIIKDSLSIIVADDSNFSLFNTAPSSFLVLACIFACIQAINNRRSES